MKKKIIFLSSILLTVGALIAVYFLFVAPKPLGAGPKTVTLEVKTPDKDYRQEIKTDADFAFDALYAVRDKIDLKYTEYPFGNMIDGFYGVDSDGMLFFYKFFINGEESMLGASAQEIKDGDIISFIFTDDFAIDYEGVRAAGGGWIYWLVTGVLVAGGVTAYIILDKKHAQHG